MASHDSSLFIQPGGEDDEQNAGKQNESQPASSSETRTTPEGRTLFLHMLAQAQHGPRKPAEPKAAKAFGELYRQFRPQLVRYLQWGRRDDQAEDRAQDVFITVWRYLPKWDVMKSPDPERAFRRLLVLIADQNRAKLWHRRRLLTFLSYEELDEEPDAGELDHDDRPSRGKLTRLLRTREDRIRHSGRYLSERYTDEIRDPEDFVAVTEFERLLALLSPRQRQCWQLRQAGYPSTEIADIIMAQTGRPIEEETVNGYVCRAKQQLAKLMALESGR